MKRLSSLAFVGALALASLTACSSGGDIDDFCSVTSSVGSDSEFEFEDLSDSTMEEALAGDMSGVNEWGESSIETIDEMTTLIERAKKGAPTDEVTEALGDVSDVMELMRDFASTAAESTDFQEFVAEAESLEDEIGDLDATMSAASEVLDDAEAEYCS